MVEGEPHVLVVSADALPTGVERALLAAGLRVSATSLAEPVMARTKAVRPDVVVVAYRAVDRHRAWDVLTVLRGSRELRATPVVVATDDAEQVDVFRVRFAGMGIGVLIDPDDAALVDEVRRRAAS